MEWLFVGIGVALLIALGWYLHRRFGAEPIPRHRANSPIPDYDQGEVAKAHAAGINHGSH